MSNLVRVRFCQIVRERGLIPETVLSECLREEASHDGTNFPLVELLIQRHLLDPSEIAGILVEVGYDHLACQRCGRRHPVQEYFDSHLRPSLSCTGCGVPLQFVSSAPSSAPTVAFSPPPPSVPTVPPVPAPPTPPVPSSSAPTIAYSPGGAGADLPQLPDLAVPDLPSPPMPPDPPAAPAGGWQEAATLRLGPDPAPPGGGLEIDLEALGLGADAGQAQTLRVEGGPAGTGTTPTLPLPGGGPALFAPTPPAPPTAPAAPPTPLSPGELVDDRYEILNPLAGYVGAVYKALERGLDRPVALKLMSRSAQERLARQIDAIGKLSHPNIITILNVGNRQGTDYYVLEFVEGAVLRDRLASGAFDLTDAVKVSRDLADALQHAHSRGLVHGLLSPSSVQVDAAGHPYIVDFCLTPVSQGQADRLWLAPEVAAGYPATDKSDVFSVGAMLYHLLTGQAPAPAPAGPAPNPSDKNAKLPIELCAICRQALEPNPANRQSSVQALRQALDSFLESNKLASRQLPRPRSWRRIASAVIWLAVIGGLGYGVVYSWPMLMGSGETIDPLPGTTDGGGGGDPVAGNGGGNGGATSGGSNGGSTPSVANWATAVAEAREAFRNDKMLTALQKLQEAQQKGANLESADLAPMYRELEVYNQAKEFVRNPVALCRYLAANGLPYVKRKPFQALATDAQLWQLEVQTEPAGAEVVMYPVDSLTGDVSRDPAQALKMGQTPVRFPFVNQAVYQIEVRHADQRITFPVEFRRDILDQSNRPRLKRFKLALPVEDGMVLVPAASGSAFVQEAGADRDFLIDRYEVTNKEFAEFMAKVPVAPPATWRDGTPPPGSDKLPALGVRWDSAVYFALWAGKRLPTKIEWRKAAGGQDNREYPWGGTFNPANAVVREKNKPAQPRPVGGRASGASPYGVEDMSGNAGEMVLPTTPVNKGKMLLLGGSFVRPATESTIGSQQVLERSQISAEAGLRCVRSMLVDKTGAPIDIAKALEDEYPGVVIEALRQLAAKPSVEGREQVFARLSHADEMVRIAAQFYLMQSEEAGLREFLSAKLASAKPEERLGAVRAISSRLKPGLMGLLTAVAGDASDKVRAQAYAVLVRLDDPQLKKVLLTGLTDKVAGIRQRCAMALARHPGPQVHAALIERLSGDKAAPVRLAAAQVLCRFGVTAAIEPAVELTLGMEDARARGQLLGLVALFGPEKIVPLAEKALADGTPVGRRNRAIELLANLGAVQHTDAFIRLVGDRAHASYAIWGLARLQSPRALAAVLPFLERPNLPPSLAMQILTAAAELKEEAAVPALIKLAARPGLPQNVLGSLPQIAGRIGGPAAQNWLYSICTTPNHPLQARAWMPLAMSGHPKALEALATLARRVTRTRDRLIVQMFMAIAGHQPLKESMLKAVQSGQVPPGQQLTLLARGLGYLLDDEELGKLLLSTRPSEVEAGVTGLQAPRHAKIARAVLTQALAKADDRRKVGLLTALRQMGRDDLLPEIRELAKRDNLDNRLQGAVLSALSELQRVTYRRKMAAADAAAHPVKAPDDPKKKPGDPEKKPGDPKDKPGGGS